MLRLWLLLLRLRSLRQNSCLIRNTFSTRRTPRAGRAAACMGEMKARPAVLWFNLDWPIAPQLANANNLLLTLENSQRQFRIREDNYRAYLRVLDTKAAGAKLKKIAEELYPKLPAGSGLQRVRDHLKAAENIRDYLISG